MNFEIIGIGSALTDMTFNVTDSFLASENLPKGGMTLIEKDRLFELLDKFKNTKKQMSPGGATANVITSYAHCTGKAAFIGKIGADNTGDFFKKETEKSGVKFIELKSDKLNSGIVLSFITQDGQRTFATHLGASVDLSPKDLTAELLNQAPVVHVEAYLVFNRDVINHIFNLAKKNNQKISMDLSSFTVVSQNLDFFRKIVENEVDILFANEDECKAYTGLSPKDSIDIFRKSCPISVLKEGANGSYISTDKETVFFSAEKVNVIDTNGAGDAYAGGVLYGLCNNLGIHKAGLIGTKAGALAVSQSGARLNNANVKKLKKYVKEIKNG
ncbi:MAG: PfkB family carbohydrate kinase [uncultured bacterium]|nr:MAG: PfkB family carbohydrate kinase [uncultured bacterium]